MPYTPGPNSGLRGAFENPQTMGGAAGAILYADVLSFAIVHSSSSRPMLGRGDTTNFPKFQVTSAAGAGEASGTVESASAPLPSDWRNKQVVLKQYIDSERYSSRTVLINSFEIERQEKKENLCKFTIKWTAVTAETYNFPTGSTNPGGVSDPAHADQQQFAGTQKGYDHNGLAPPPTYVHVIWWDDAVANTDAAEQTKIIAAAGAVTTPFTTPHNYKQRGVTFTRLITNGGDLVYEYGLTDTKDDVLLPLNTANVDQSTVPVDSSAHSAAINTTAPDPAIPHTVLAFNNSHKLNDSNTLNEAVYQPRTPQEAVEQDGTFAKFDATLLTSSGQSTVAYFTEDGSPGDTDSPDPGQLKIVGHEDKEITDDASVHVTYFDVNSSAEKVIFPESITFTDASGIKSTKTIGSIYTTGSEPSAPGASGLVLRNRKAYVLTSPDTSNKSVTFWLYAETTEADELIFDKTRTAVDPHDIKSESSSAAIFTTGSPPSDPSRPTGFRLVDHADIPLTDASASNKSIRVYRYSKLDSLDELKLPKLKTTIDGNHIADEAVRTQEWLTTDSPPATPDDAPTNNVKLIALTDLTITPAIDAVAGTMLRVWLYGAKDSRDEAVLPNFETTTDASTLILNSAAIRAYLDGDSVPSTPSGLKLVATKARPLTLSLGTNRTLTILVFGLATEQDKKETEPLKTHIDGGFSLEDRAVRTKIWTASGSPPSAPDSVPTNNVKLLGYDDVGVPENPLLLMRVWVYGPKSSADERTLGRGKWETATDASGLESTAIRAYLDGSSPASTVTDGNGDTLVTVKTYVAPETAGLGTNRILTIVEYALATTQQEEEFRNSEYTADPLDLYKYRSASIISSTTAINTLGAALLAANQSDKTFIQALLKRHTPGKVLEILEFTGEDKKWHSFSGGSQWKLYRGKPTGGFGSAGSLILVYPDGTTSTGSGILSGRPMMIPFVESVETFRFRRRIVTNTPGDYVFIGSKGTVNNAPYGVIKSGGAKVYPAYTVWFEDSEMIFSEAISGAHVMVTDYLMRYSEVTLDDGSKVSGHMNLEMLPNDTIYCRNLSITFGLTDYYNPILYAGTHAIVKWPNVTSFSVFT